MTNVEKKKPVRWLEFCYSPVRQGYFIWDWTGNVNISRYNWHHITIFNALYAVMDNQDVDEAQQILGLYLENDEHGLVYRIRLD